MPDHAALAPRRRAAIYARFSTDLQSDRSLRDQEALCRNYAAAQGHDVATVYVDSARTSASLIGRAGILDLMADAKTGAFDVVIVEALDRISRDQEDLAGIFKRLEFAGIPILAVHEGQADAVHIGLRGIMGELFLRDLKDKMRRGYMGVLRDGRSCGGRAYGYAPVPGQTGELTIVEAEAAVIRRIFHAYVGGDTPRTIAAALNADGVPAPRGARWSASSINGSPARGHGILWNDIYNGERVWNRVRMVLDPDTGKRVSRVNPQADWQRFPAPGLRIVPADLFAAARARKDARAGKTRGQRLTKLRRPFSGLLVCGACGGGMTQLHKPGGRVYVNCTRARESGTCDRRKSIRFEDLQRSIFAEIADTLGDPVYVKEYLREYHAERARMLADAGAVRGRLERAATRAAAAFDRAHQLYVDGVTDGPTAIEKLRSLGIARDTAVDALEACDTPSPVLALHPAATARYLDALADIGGSMTGDGGTLDQEAVGALRELISHIVVDIGPTGPTASVHGYLAALVGEADCLTSVVAWGRRGQHETVLLARCDGRPSAG